MIDLSIAMYQDIAESDDSREIRDELSGALVDPRQTGEGFADNFELPLHRRSKNDIANKLLERFAGRHVCNCVSSVLGVP